MSASIYHAFGFAFSSEIELPSVAMNESDRTPSASVRLGSVPLQLENAKDRGVAYEVAENEFLLRIDGVARYLVRGGNEIIVEPAPDSSPLDVRLFLMGSAFGALIHQRGLVPLHASAVAIDDGCIAFTGHAGAGKSTLAAYMHQRGYKILCDDVCPFQISDGLPLVAPGFARVKLWANSLESMGISTDSVSRVREELEKYELPVDFNNLTEAVPLKRLYILEDTNSADDEGIEPVSKSQRFEALMTSTYRYQFIEAMGRRLPHFQTCVQALNTLIIMRIKRRRNLDRMDELVDWIEHDINSSSE